MSKYHIIWPYLTSTIMVRTIYIEVLYLYFIKNCKICQYTKDWRKDLDCAPVITETYRTSFVLINIDILQVPTKNSALTIRDELTKFSQAYAIGDKSVKTVRNLYFKHALYKNRVFSTSTIKWILTTFPCHSFRYEIFFLMRWLYIITLLIKLVDSHLKKLFF